jgi:hypothetical protein
MELHGVLALRVFTAEAPKALRRAPRSFRELHGVLALMHNGSESEELCGTPCISVV